MINPTAPLAGGGRITLAFGGIKALTGVGFRVQPGSITTVIGPNGAGKTSLFNTISGFYHPASARSVSGRRYHAQASARARQADWLAVSRTSRCSAA